MSSRTDAQKADAHDLEDIDLMHQTTDDISTIFIDWPEFLMIVARLRREVPGTTPRLRRRAKDSYPRSPSPRP